MIIDHVGIAVRSIDTAIQEWKAMFGYTQASEPVVNSRQKVKVVFLSKTGSLPIKLIEPTDPSSPIHSFCQRGGGLHHLCFKCNSVDSQVKEMELGGARVLSAAQPGEAFEGELIAFIYAAGLNVELIDTERRSKWIAN